ncbi:MAG TPA: HAD hydrolase-like protein [Candidatus Elarobacter sp.]|nr:HAD hydrolase-like protein [Candidatus Elarobacter sp.]
MLLDFDYTLVDASVCLFAGLHAGLAAIGVSPPEPAALKRLIGIPLRDQFAMLAPSSSAVYHVFETAYLRARDAHEVDGIVAIKGAAVALRSLTTAHMTTAIISTAARGRIERALERLCLAAYITDGVVAGSHDKASALRTARARFDGLGELVYVADRPDDAEAAATAGTGFIGVCTGAFGPAEFPPRTRTVPSIASVPAALGLG